jgi:hypothetical protein
MKIRTSTIAAAVLFTSTAAMASDDGPAYYSGAFNCDQGPLNTDWVVTRNFAGQSTTTVYYQQQGSDQVQWLQLTEQQTSDGNILVDDNGHSRLALSGGGDTIQATWMKGPPSRGCQAFEVKKTDSVKERFDRFFALLETPHPTKEEARQVSEAVNSMPIVFALPELDQQPYVQRLATAVPEFWQRYRSSLVDDIASLPLTSGAERASYIELLRTTISEALPSLVKRGRDRKAREDMTLVLQMASDRLADAGYPTAAAYDVGNVQIACERLSLMNKSFFQLDDLEFVAGVSFDYWTRDIAEHVLRGAKACGNAEHYVSSLMDKWPSIQDKQTKVVAIKVERDRLLALPLTFATLIETKNLQPDRQKLNIRYGEQALQERFFGRNLEARRNDLFDAVMTEVNESATSNIVDQAENVRRLGKNCDQLRYLDGLEDEKRNRIDAACQTSLSAIAQKQADEGLKRINAALEAAEPLTPSAEQVRQVCQELSGGFLLPDAVAPLRNACERGEITLKEKEEAQRCVIAIEKSGADGDFLETTIAVKHFGQDNRTTMRELVCTAAKHEFQLSFRSEGVLMWSKQLMELHRTDGGVKAFSVELTSAEEVADWKVSSWVGDLETGPNDTPLDEITACIMGSAGCQH